MGRSLFDVIMGFHPPEEPKKTESWFGLGGKSNKPIVPLTSKQQKELGKHNKRTGQNNFVGMMNGQPSVVIYKDGMRHEFPLDGGPGVSRAIDSNDRPS